jgi:hypothetical protein
VEGRKEYYTPLLLFTSNLFTEWKYAFKFFRDFLVDLNEYYHIPEPSIIHLETLIEKLDDIISKCKLEDIENKELIVAEIMISLKHTHDELKLLLLGLQYYVDYKRNGIEIRDDKFN